MCFHKRAKPAWFLSPRRAELSLSLAPLASANIRYVQIVALCVLRPRPSPVRACVRASACVFSSADMHECRLSERLLNGPTARHACVGLNGQSRAAQSHVLFLCNHLKSLPAHTHTLTDPHTQRYAYTHTHVNSPDFLCRLMFVNYFPAFKMSKRGLYTIFGGGCARGVPSDMSLSNLLRFYSFFFYSRLWKIPQPPISEPLEVRERKKSANRW